MRKLLKILFRDVRFRTCYRCGYSGGGWKDDDYCPACGEVN